MSERNVPECVLTDPLTEEERSLGFFGTGPALPDRPACTHKKNGMLKKKGYISKYSHIIPRDSYISEASVRLRSVAALSTFP